MPEPDYKRSGLSERRLLAGAALLIAAAALVVRYLPVDNHAVLIAAALSPYLALAGGFFGLALLWRRPRVAALPALVLAATVAVQAPQFFHGWSDTDNTIPIRVLTANLREGAADPEAVAQTARQRADLLLVQELSHDMAYSLGGYLQSDFPYQVLYPANWAAGVGIWSRYPIVQSTRITRYILGALTATVRPPRAADDVEVASIHLVGPWPQPLDKWRDEIAALPDTLTQLAAQAGAGAVIVAGDLNATVDHKPFRRLLEAGFQDAGRQAGFGATYPAARWFPPLIRIDHILTHNATATDAQTVRIAGSDHLGLTATVHVPG